MKHAVPVNKMRTVNFLSMSERHLFKIIYIKIFNARPSGTNSVAVISVADIKNFVWLEIVQRQNFF